MSLAIPRSAVALLLTLAHAWVCLAQQCSPIFPAAIFPPAGDPHDPTKIQGNWFTYRQLTVQSTAITINQQIQWTTTFSSSVETLTNKPAQSVQVQFIQYDSQESADNRACNNRYWSGLYVNDGRLMGQTAIVGNYFGNNGTATAPSFTNPESYTLRTGSYAIMYHDYNRLLIWYSCEGHRMNGSCVTPVIFIHTRVKPTKMADSEKAALDKIIDDTFSQFCLKAADLPFQPYRDDLADCVFKDPPVCVTNYNSGLRLLGQTSQPAAADNMGSIAASCKLPNYVADGYVANDPLKAEGLWYAYRSSLGGPGLKYNWKTVGEGFMPFSNTSAQLQWMQLTFASSGNSYGCQHSYWAGQNGVDGQSDGTFGPNDGPAMFGPLSANGERIILKYVVIRLDANFALYYGCFVPDTASANCLQPFLLAGTRTNPSQLSAADKANFDANINAFLGKYGCKATDVWEVATSTQMCDFQEDGCVRANVNGLQGELAQPNSATAQGDTGSTAAPGSTTAGPVVTTGGTGNPVTTGGSVQTPVTTGGSVQTPVTTGGSMPNPAYGG